jgi:hypothetical protein
LKSCSRFGFELIVFENAKRVGQGCITISALGFTRPVITDAAQMREQLAGGDGKCLGGKLATYF